MVQEVCEEEVGSKQGKFAVPFPRINFWTPPASRGFPHSRRSRHLIQCRDTRESHCKWKTVELYIGVECANKDVKKIRDIS
jgi:hypothetical protein